MLRTKRCANTSTASLLLLSVACGVGHALPSSGKEEYVVCSSPVCLQRAQEIKESINTHADPCEDFYSYACGGWIKNHTIPESKPSYGLFDVLNDALEETLRDMLGNMTIVYDGNQNATDKAALAYNACMAVPEAGDQHHGMWQIMNDSGLAEWPFLTKEEQGLVEEINLTKVLLDVGLRPILKLTVERDSTYITSYVITLDQISFRKVGRNQLIHPNKEGNKAIIAAYKKLIAVAATFMDPNITEQQAKTLADEIVAFEGKLANFTSPPEKRRDVLAIHHRTTIGVLQKNVSHFPLLDLLNKEFKKINVTLNETEPLETVALDYYTRMTSFLREAKPTTVFNYLGMRTLLRWADHASENFRKAVLELEKVVSGVKKDIPRWKKCVRLVNEGMKEVTGYLYVTKNFREEAKMEVEDIIDAIKDAFNETLQKSTWMDADTRYQANLKLQEMRRKIAYPQCLLNSTCLDEFVKYIPILNTSTPFLSMWRSIKANNRKTMLGKLRKTYDADKTWMLGPAVVNAFYNPSGNEMEYPAGILQGVFYQYDVPRSINMGAIGSVAGHELTHGFDDEGSQYDAKGRLRQWWSYGSRQKYREKSQCFVEQYGSIYDQEAGMKLNGKNTLGENIADNGGLQLPSGVCSTCTLCAGILRPHPSTSRTPQSSRICEAYKNIIKDECDGKDTRLKGLEELSGEKLFFISNGMVWCSLVRPETKKFAIQYDPHSPKEYRVNMPMRNMAEFSKVFNCPTNSRMNPDRNKTCALW
ncbi:neprilysin-1-like [Haemaphysalis longicornis]